MFCAGYQYEDYYRTDRLLLTATGHHAIVAEGAGGGLGGYR